MQIKAGQHIYGNVEKEFSPSKMGGFQTLFYTSTFISEEESEEIESKLIYYPSDTTPIKFLFFNIRSGKYVISRIIPQLSADRFGRTGSYLAHSFIFSREELAKVSFNPFIIIEYLNHQFINTVEEALKKGDFKEANIGEIYFEISDESIKASEAIIYKEIQKWDSSELLKLAHFSFNNQKLKEKKTSFALFSTPEDIERALKVLFSLTPDALRLNCSFDTYFYGCNPVVNYFLAVGYPSSPNISSQFILVDAGERKIMTDTPSAVSPYEKWLFYTISGKNLLEILSYNSTAFALQHFLLDEPYDKELIKKAPLPLITNFFEVNWSHVVAKTEKNLKRTAGTDLTSLVLNKIMLRYKSCPEKLFPLLLDGFNFDEIADELYDIFISLKLKQLKYLKNKIENREQNIPEVFIKSLEQALLLKKSTEESKGIFKILSEKLLKR